MMVDGTEVPRQHPADKDGRKNTCSGKKRQFTFNTTVITDKEGLMLDVDKTFEGGRHDLAMISRDPMDVGIWSHGIYKENAPKESRMTIPADRGYQVMDRHCPGANLIVPERKPKGGELADRQKKTGKKTSRGRMTVEHGMGRIKQWGMMNGPMTARCRTFIVRL